jgi:phosphate-selective porin OprO/OprP
MTLRRALPLLLLLPGTALAQEVNLAAGALTLRPTGLLQLDAGAGFGGDAPRDGWNPRRARLGIEGEVLRSVEYRLVWDVGGTPGSRGGLHEASIAWTALEPLTLTAGVFEPSFSLAQQRDSEDLLFLERAAVTTLAAGLAADDGRVGVQAALTGERWHLAAALTGGRTGPGEDSSQRGAVARAAGLAVKTEEVALHLGASALWSFRPPRDEEGQRAIDLSAAPELEIDRRDPPLDAGSMAADGARAGGLELGLGWRGVQLQAEAYRIEIDRASGGTRRFEGWYVQASSVLVGRPREWKPDRASWSAPRAEDGARWGAVEVGARLSRLDLNDGEVRGGRQTAYAAALGWWPREAFGLLAQYQWVDVRGAETGDRAFHTLALRAQLRF